MRRVLRQRHRSLRHRRQSRVLHRLPSPRLEMALRSGQRSQAAAQRRAKAQVPLGQQPQTVLIELTESEGAKMGIEGFGYKGKRTLVVGGSSGMGAATARLLAELGADVAVADYAPVSFPVSKVIKLDLREPATIDRALEELKAPIHA